MVMAIDFTFDESDIISKFRVLRVLDMKSFVISWLMFSNIFGCIYLANQMSTAYFHGSHIPMLLAIPILCITNFSAGKMLKKQK